MSTAPNYTALVKLLPLLKRLPDFIGETILTPEEAAQIRSLGFAAMEGRWRVPPIPPELVRNNPLLENLAISWDRRETQAHLDPASDIRPSLEVRSERGPKHAVTTQPLARTANTFCVQATTDLCAPAGQGLLVGRCVKELASKIEATLNRHGGQINRRQLQQWFSRHKAPIFNQALTYLTTLGSITIERI